MGKVACAGTASILRQSRLARRLALIVVAALACLVAPALAQAVSIVQLPNKYPLAVNSQDEVLSDDGYLWENPTAFLDPPKAPASDPNATFKPAGLLSGQNAPLNDSGVVVGTVTTGSGSTVPGYWNSANSSTFTEINLSGLTICSQPVTGGSLTGIDDSGEAVGRVTSDAGGTSCPGGGDAGLYVPAVGGLPAGQPQVITSVGGIQISELEEISAGYELALESPGGTAGYGQGDPVLVNRQTQSATATNFGAGSGGMTDDNGLMVGAIVSGNGGLDLRLPGGSETPLATTGSNHAVVAVNDAGVSVGEDDCTGAENGCTVVEWSPTGSEQSLASELPADSGWTLSDATSINAQGDIVGEGTINGQNASYLLKAGTEVSGQVLSVDCSDSGCASSGLEGVPVIVTGTATDGTAVTESDVSDDDGAWSVTVPPGMYTAGPSLDGTTIDGTGFDPDQTTLQVGATPVTEGTTFLTCDLGAAAGSAADRAASPLSAASDGLGGGIVAHATSASYVSQCASVYTVTLSASLPRGVMVDPSYEAHYNVTPDNDTDGYNYKTGGLLPFLHNDILRKRLDLATEYPECLAPEAKSLAEEKATVAWYTAIHGGALGSVQIPVVYNQDDGGTVHVLAPVTTTATLTREFDYRLTIDGHTTKQLQCHETATVPVFVLPVGGADGTDAPLDPQGFTIIVGWALPFDAAGAVIDPESTIAEEIVEHAAKVTEGIYKKYEALPAPFKFILGFAVSYAIGSAEVKAVEAGPALFKRFLGKGADLFPGVLLGLKKAGLAAEYLHTASSIYELAGGLAGFLGVGHYPMMSAVIRGQFTSTPAKVNGQVVKYDGMPIPYQTTLALSVKSTRFPNITMKIYRDADTSTPNKVKVWTGYLPWATSPFGTPATYNPLAANPPGLLANAAARGLGYYYSGKTAVAHVLADTSQNPDVQKSVQESGSFEGRFNDEQDAAPFPDCSDGGLPPVVSRASTFCWTWSDWHA